MYLSVQLVFVGEVDYASGSWKVSSALPMQCSLRSVKYHVAHGVFRKPCVFVFCKELIAHRQKFATEKLIAQYFGLIRNNMMDVESRKHAHTPKEGKLFYQVK